MPRGIIKARVRTPAGHKQARTVPVKPSSDNVIGFFELAEKVSAKYKVPKQYLKWAMYAVMHELVCNIKSGNAVRLPYVGTLYPDSRVTMKWVGVHAMGQRKAVVHNSVKYLPSQYMRHVVMDPSRYRDRDMKDIRDVYTRGYWEHTQKRFNEQEARLHKHEYLGRPHRADRRFAWLDDDIFHVIEEEMSKKTVTPVQE